MTYREVLFPDGKLVHGDSLDVIQDVTDQTVDMVFTSPPYFVGKDYDSSIAAEDFFEIVSKTHDQILPKIKDGGSLCWQVGNHVQSAELTPLDFLVFKDCARFTDLKLRNRVIWTFEHGFHAQRRLSGRYEVVLWYTKGEDYKFDLDKIRIPQKYPGKKHYKGPKKGELSGNPRGKNPGDVWSIPNVKANHVEKTEHPCQFPVALVSRFTRALCPEHGLIVDPFSGASSTAIAALETGRRFLCIELERKYFDISERRISSWYEGNSRIRKDVPTQTPNPRDAVAQRPPHFCKEETA